MKRLPPLVHFEPSPLTVAKPDEPVLNPKYPSLELTLAPFLIVSAAVFA